MPKKFLFLLYSHEKSLKKDGGGFRKPWILAENLQSLGQEVFILSQAIDFTTKIPHGIIATPPWPLIRPLWVYAWQFIRGLLHILLNKVDYIYFRSSNSRLPAWLSRLTGARLILEVNGDAAWEAERDGNFKTARLIRWIEQKNVRDAHRVVTLTEGLSKMLHEKYGVPARKIAIVPSGSDTGHFYPRKSQALRQKLGVQEGESLLGLMGIFYKHQGGETFLRAGQILLQEGLKIRLIFIGDGPEKAKWQNLARELNIQGQCRFLGQVPYDEVPAVVAALDLAVAPLTGSRGEASPLKVFDYLSSGLPVVISRLPTLASLIGESEALVPVEPDSPEALAQGLRGLLKDPAKAQGLGKAGRAFVEAHYAWKTLSQRFLKFCEES